MPSSLRELYETAIALPQAARGTFLDAHCSDASVRVRIERMLARAPAEGDDALPLPPAAALADVLDAGIDEQWLTPGARIGGFELVEVLGGGGSSIVFRAQRLLDGVRQDVALKVLRRGLRGEDDHRRFRDERRALAQLRHPGIARLIEGGIAEPGVPYIALELVDGLPIVDHANQHQLGLRERLRVFIETCAAVEAAHRALIVHRDLKPSNVLVNTDGAVKLLDFGIAKLLDVGDDTRTLHVALTPAYAAPEQFSGGAITTATDVYALGVLLDELVTGMRREPGDTRPPSARISATTGRERLPAAPHTTRRLLRGDLDNIVLKATADEPARRYGSAGALADDIERLLDGRPVSAHPPTRWYRTRKFVLRHKGGVASSAAFLLTILATLGIALWQAGVARGQAALAHAEAVHADAIRGFLVGVFDHAEPDANHGQAVTARQLLEGGERELHNGSLTPATRLDLGVLLARLYWDLGDAQRAQGLLAKALAASSQAGVPPREKARTLLATAKIEADQRVFDAAADHARQGAAIAATLGPSAFDLQSDARRIIALALLGKDDAVAAEPVLREALAFDRAHYGEHNAATIEDAIQLGNALTEQSRFDESIALLRNAVEQARALHGPVHSQLASALQELSGALAYRGDFDGSIAASREAADIDEKIYGPAHNETLVARGNQFWSTERAGRYADALQGRLAFVPLLDGSAATRPETAAAWYTSIAQDEARLGRYADAESMFRKALATWRALQGSNDEWDSADPMVGLADALRWDGRHDEAIALLRRAIAIEEKHEPADSVWLNRDRGTLGDMLRQQGRYTDALHELDAAAHARRAAKPDPLFASLLAQWSQAQLDAGDVNAAQATAQRSVEIARAAYRRGQSGLVYPLLSLARVELSGGHPQVAEPLLRESRESRAALPDSDLHVLEVDAARVQALVALGRSAEADALRARIEPLLAASHSPYAAILRERERGTPVARR